MDVSSLQFLIFQEINYFEGVHDSDCTKTTSIEDILTSIKDGVWKDEVEALRAEKSKDIRNELKRQFIGVTFSGNFSGRRLDRNLDLYTHIMVVDVDLKDLKTKPATARKVLENTHFIFAVFESPSGGFEALAYSRMPKENHKIFFDGVEDYFLYNHSLKIDASGKNPGRLCFISWDPELYLEHHGKRPFNLKQDSKKVFNNEESKNFREVKSVDYTKYKESANMGYIMPIAKNRTKNNVGAFHSGNRNNYVFGLACVLNRAGVNKEISIDAILQNYPSLGLKEIEGAVKSAYSHNSYEFGSKPIYEKQDGQSEFF